MNSFGACNNNNNIVAWVAVANSLNEVDFNTNKAVKYIQMNEV